MSELKELLINISEEKQNKILPENLKAGVEAFGVTGNFTSDATATSQDILKDKTAYVNGEKVIGTLEISSGGDSDSEYQQLEYIHSSGTQYIDTKVVPDSTGYSAILEYYIIGGHLSLGYNIYLFGQTDGSKSWRCGGGISGSSYLNLDTSSGFSYTTNNNDQKALAISLANTATFQYPMILFGQQKNGTASDVRYSKYRLYNCKIYKDATIIRDFIPCRRKSDNEIGLLDLVTKEFYKNSGTGAFIAGPEIQ